MFPKRFYRDKRLISCQIPVGERATQREFTSRDPKSLLGTGQSLQAGGGAYYSSQHGQAGGQGPMSSLAKMQNKPKGQASDVLRLLYVDAGLSIVVCPNPTGQSAFAEPWMTTLLF